MRTVHEVGTEWGVCTSLRIVHEVGTEWGVCTSLRIVHEVGTEWGVCATLCTVHEVGTEWGLSVLVYAYCKWGRDRMRSVYYSLCTVHEVGTEWGVCTSLSVLTLAHIHLRLKIQLQRTMHTQEYPVMATSVLSYFTISAEKFHIFVMVNSFVEAHSILIKKQDFPCSYL
jgi:hypothetical protein